MKARARTRARRRGPPASRDQEETAFAAILGALVARVPGARAAALVDFHGETVDYTGRMVPFDLRVAAAHWRIVLHEAAAQRSLSRLAWLIVGVGRSGYLVHALPDDYALIVAFSRRAGFAGWQRAVATCAAALGVEAGWESVAPPCVDWRPAWVLADERLRPRSVRWAGRFHSVEILGKLASRTSLPERELAGGSGDRARGWRVRLQTGLEATLMREPGGAWYSDEPFDDPAFAPGPRRVRPRKTR
jgi:hypothetical protein